MQRPWLILLLLATSVTAPPAAADERPTLPEQRLVMVGRCELVADPVDDGHRPPSVLGCVKGAAGGEVVFVSGTPEENYWLKYGHLYGGLFITEWVSLQARGYARQAVPLGDLGLEERDVDTDYVALKVGNPATHAVRLTAGHVRLPFGVDRSDVVETFKWREDRRFWSSPEHGAYVTLDDHRSLQVDIGYGTDVWTDRAAEVTAPVAPVDQPVVQAGSMRVMSDFAALDGSRLVLSGYGQSNGVRRMGMAFVTVSAKEDLTLFEFARRLATPGGQTEPFNQLLRLGYVGAWRGDTRWVVQVDDERARFRRGLVGYDAKVYEHALLRLGVAYQKSETGDGQRRWYVTYGLEARL